MTHAGHRIDSRHVWGSGHRAHVLVCRCPTWGLLNKIQRDIELADLMDWAWVFHYVSLKLLCRGDHVAVCEIMSHTPGHGHARKVMTDLCEWADCARVTLELSPSAHWGADTARLTSFYTSLGFVPNHEPRTPYPIQETMIRYPTR